MTTFPDETDPDNASAAIRKPVWNAGRVLGYTDPVDRPGADARRRAGRTLAAKAPAISVWPGRKMVWATGSGVPTVPLTRQEFVPDPALLRAAASTRSARR